MLLVFLKITFQLFKELDNCCISLKKIKFFESRKPEPVRLFLSVCFFVFQFCVKFSKLLILKIQSEINELF